MTLALLLERSQTRPLDTDGVQLVEAMRRQDGDDGAPLSWEAVPTVIFRYVDDGGETSFSLRHDDMVVNDGRPQRLRDLLEEQWPYRPAELIAAVWHCADYDALVTLIQTLKVVARFFPTLDGRMQAHLISASYCVNLIRRHQAGERFLPDGELVLEALTRTLGIRAKVQLLTRQLRGLPERRRWPRWG